MGKFPLYLYELPIRARRELVALLDHGDTWKDLAELGLNYDQVLIHRFQQHQYQPGTSPSEALLTYLGQRNVTSDDLFLHLNSLGLYRVMAAMMEVVSPSMRHLAHNKSKEQVSEATTVPLQVRLEPPTKENSLDKASEGSGNSPNEDLLRRGNVEAVVGGVQRLSLSTSVTSATENTKENNNARLRSRFPSNSSLKTTTRSVSESSGTPMLRNINFEELARACNDFDTPIGRGGFGQVFRGKWNGQDVAVKRILEERRGTEMSVAKVVSQAITELNALHAFPAENILPLLAYSYDSNNVLSADPICLVYQYMPRGSVADRLRRRGNTPPLSWEQRANIALGTARGLRHLHANKIIHGDIKSGNILLDKHFEPKIGDFGLARMNMEAMASPEASEASFFMVSVVKGTEAYLPLDYIRSRQLSPAVDTFCFGIFTFELVTSKSPSFVVTKMDEDNKETRMRMRDVMLESDRPEPYVDDALPPAIESRKWSHILYYVGKDCAQKAWRNRPPMEQVLDALERLVSQFASPALALQLFYDEKQQQAQPQQQLEQGHQVHRDEQVRQAEPGVTSASLMGSRSRRREESSGFVASVLNQNQTVDNEDNKLDDNEDNKLDDDVDDDIGDLDHLALECLPAILVDDNGNSDLIRFSEDNFESKESFSTYYDDNETSDASLKRLQEVEAASSQLDDLDML